MRDASPTLIALLNGSRQYIMADVYEFALTDGTFLRYSGAQIALSSGGHDFVLGPKFERSKVKTVIGTEVDELEVTIYPEPTDLVGSFSFLEAAWNGIFDGASLRMERAFMPSWGDTSPGTVVLFTGRVADIDCGRTAITMKCRSLLELLNIEMPRRLFQASCGHVFGDAMCQFDRSSLATLAFPCLIGSTQKSILATLTPSPPTVYNQGTIVGVTGDNTGHTRSVIQYTGGVIYLRQPFLYAVETGDEFQLLPGCDKTLPTCQFTFSNDEHFGGFQFIPVAETGVAIALAVMSSFGWLCGLWA